MLIRRLKEHPVGPGTEARAGGAQAEGCSGMSYGARCFVHAGPTGTGNLPQVNERGGELVFAEMLGWVGKRGRPGSANQRAVADLFTEIFENNLD